MDAMEYLENASRNIRNCQKIGNMEFLDAALEQIEKAMEDLAGDTRFGMHGDE